MGQDLVSLEEITMDKEVVQFGCSRALRRLNQIEQAIKKRKEQLLGTYRKGQEYDRNKEIDEYVLRMVCEELKNHADCLETLGMISSDTLRRICKFADAELSEVQKMKWKEG